MTYQVVKTFGHERGLSCAFRQWKATHSHCSKLHGYALAFEITLESAVLDSRNWVFDFGNFDKVKTFLESTFDHTTVIAMDDPQQAVFRKLDEDGVIDLRELPRVGCESFAELVYNYVSRIARDCEHPVRVVSVKCSEHGANAAVYKE